jgi:hypothetical protein
VHNAKRIERVRNAKGIGSLNPGQQLSEAEEAGDTTADFLAASCQRSRILLVFEDGAAHVIISSKPIGAHPALLRSDVMCQILRVQFPNRMIGFAKAEIDRFVFLDTKSPP